MIEHGVRRWLSRWIWSNVTINLVAGALIGLLGLAIVAVTWAICYAASLFILGPWLGHQHWFHPAFGLLLLPLLFLGSARRSIDSSTDYSVSTGTATDTVVKFYLPRIGPVSNINPLAPDTAGSIGRLVGNCLCIGPTVVLLSLQTLHKGVGIARIRRDGCSQVVAALLTADRRMTFEEIVKAAPGINPVRVFADLSLIDGILFLESDPPGLSLSGKLKKELRKAVRARSQPETPNRFRY